MTCFALGVTGILAWTPVSLTRIFGLGAGHVGMVLGAVIAAASLAGVTAGNFILRHFQRRLGYRAAPRIIWVSLIASVPLSAWSRSRQPRGRSSLCRHPGLCVDDRRGFDDQPHAGLAPPEVRARIMALRAMINGPAIGLGVAGSAFLGDASTPGLESLFWGGWCLSMPAWILCIVLLRLAEKTL